MLKPDTKIKAQVTYVCMLRDPLAIGVGPPVAIKIGHSVASVAAKQAIRRYAGRCLIALKVIYQRVIHKVIE